MLDEIFDKIGSFCDEAFEKNYLFYILLGIIFFVIWLVFFR